MSASKITSHPLTVTMRVDQWLMIIGWMEAQQPAKVRAMLAEAIAAAMEA